MANRTAKDAHSVKGTNPQYLVEKIIRNRIYESKYWKEECFALTAELLVDKAMQLRSIGGIYGGNIKPTPFICLILKLLQIQPEKDIIIEFIKNEDFKYVRALGATYLRLTGSSTDCYKYLEPLYLDYRKVRKMDRQGAFSVQHMDEFIDDLLREERVIDVILPRIQKRHVLEESNQIEARMSALDDDLDMDISDTEEGEYQEPHGGHHSPERHRHRTPSPRYRHRSKSPHKSRRSRSRDRDRHDRERERDNRTNRYREEKHRDDRHREDKHRDREEKHRDREEKHREDKHRTRKRSRSRSRERHRHSHKHSRHHDEERSHRHRKSKKEHRDKHKHHKGSKDQQEIDDANAMREKLGLAPLK